MVRHESNDEKLPNPRWDCYWPTFSSSNWFKMDLSLIFLSHCHHLRTPTKIVAFTLQNNWWPTWLNKCTNSFLFFKKKKKNQSFFYHFASAKIFSTDNEMLLRICMGTSRQGSTRSVLGFEKHKGRPQSFFFLYLFHHCTTILNRKSKPTYHTDHFHMLINNLSLQYQIVYSGRDKLIKLEKSEWGKRVKHESKSNQVRTSWF